MLQPGASARPVMTKRSCTEPSLTPLLFLKRASRTGPFGVMNHGTVFFAPSKVATAIKGFCAGLVPPEVLGDFTQNDGLSLWDSYSARRPYGRSSQNWPARNLQNSSAEFLQKSPFKGELAKLLGEALLKTRSALWLSPGQLCRLPWAAEHASRGCGGLRGAPVQNLVVPINDCQRRMPHNAHLRIGFISCR